MKTIEIVNLIEDAEQGSSLQCIEDGKAAREELNNLILHIQKLEMAVDVLKMVHEDAEDAVMLNRKNANGTCPITWTTLNRVSEILSILEESKNEN